MRVSSRHQRAIILLLLLSFLPACSSEQQPSPVYNTGSQYSNSTWTADDLAAGPVEILKAPFAAVSCPFRLLGKDGSSLSMERDGVAPTLWQGLIMPVRAVIDGATTGVGYLLGGAIDTVSGGTAGMVSSVSRTKEPNGNIECVLAGR